MGCIAWWGRQTRTVYGSIAGGSGQQLPVPFSRSLSHPANKPFAHTALKESQHPEQSSSLSVYVGVCRDAQVRICCFLLLVLRTDSSSTVHRGRLSRAGLLEGLFTVKLFCSSRTLHLTPPHPPLPPPPPPVPAPSPSVESFW